MSRTPDRQFQAALRHHLTEVIDRTPTPQHGSRAVTARPARDWLRLSVAGLVAVAAISATWSGLAAIRQHTPDQPPAVSSPTTSPSDTPSPSSGELLQHIEQVTGRGRLTGPITGTFTIAYDTDGAMVLHLRDLDVGTSTARTFQFAANLASATCEEDDVGLLHGDITAVRTQDIELRDPAITGPSDLSYMHALAIWPSADRDSCTPARVSAGTITWTLPAAIRALGATDSGSTAGATGSVQTKHGRPQTYTVAADDRLDAVLTRFDLTFDELLYLNPFRTRGSSTELFTDEQLTLDATARRP